MTSLSSEPDGCLLDPSVLTSSSFERIALILGDQLNASHSWYREVDPQRLFVIMEVRQETDYATHHIQKVVGFFAAMRKFAAALTKAGHEVLYLTLNASVNQQDVCNNLTYLTSLAPKLTRIDLQQPDEYRVDAYLQAWAEHQSLTVTWHDTEHFLCERNVLSEWFPQKQNFLMESFYRRVRKLTGYLMENGKPIGGKWNFDKENRNKLPTHHEVTNTLCFADDVGTLVNLIKKSGVKTIGEINPHQFIWPITRAESRQLLEYFVQNLLPEFGRYQDAMHTDHWSLYHARLSFALNTKMISPREVVETAIRQWQQHPDTIDIAQVEGFVRQIIGWREFIRAIYWHHMPGYEDLNFFNNKQPLPDFYWTGDTRMQCLASSIKQSLKYAYAHHIQRLMITGNFALLIGAAPDAVDDWYLGIYIDAIEWVELPNTRGMSQFADAGILATKPYVSSGSYINKMSNYCANCHYDVNQRTGDNACPFNSLYWNFINEHQHKLSNNPRMGLILNQWQKRSPEQQQELVQQAKLYLGSINHL
ncbi:cryptochrome/photolyase family protein [Pseudidiomarina sp.]|uniref:cryptochrome/photolyase family protein n=1 Tax=Pseudidiomarina sp. TaxID=2081707 RepID=UPI003A973370